METLALIDRELTQGFLIQRFSFQKKKLVLQLWIWDMALNSNWRMIVIYFLKELEGMFPIYLAMEDSMQDEVIRSTQVEIIPQLFDEVPAENQPIIIHNRDGQDDQTLMAENGDRFIYDNPIETFSKLLQSHQYILICIRNK